MQIELTVINDDIGQLILIC